MATDRAMKWQSNWESWSKENGREYSCPISIKSTTMLIYWLDFSIFILYSTYHVLRTTYQETFAISCINNTIADGIGMVHGNEKEVFSRSPFRWRPFYYCCFVFTSLRQIMKLMYLRFVDAYVYNIFK